MKKIISLALMLTCGIFYLNAQGTKIVEVKFVNKKGKPLSMNNVNTYTTSNPVYQDINSNGYVAIPAYDDDTLVVFFSNYKAFVPLEYIDEITLSPEKGKIYVVENGERTMGDFRIEKLPAFDPLNIAETTDTEAFPDIISLIKVKFPSITLLQNGEAQIMGNQGNALIILDGSPQSNLSTVSAMINPNQLKSIEIRKADALYGTQGSNGVIIIKTKQGR